jgi:hypothetical protein
MLDLFRLEKQSKADFDPRRARPLVTLTIQRLPFGSITFSGSLGRKDLPHKPQRIAGIFLQPDKMALEKWR